MQPANHYASKTQIPQFVEDLIEIECRDGLAHLIRRLATSVLDQREFDETPYSEDSKEYLEWILDQDDDTKGSLLKWIVNELI